MEYKPYLYAIIMVSSIFAGGITDTLTVTRGEYAKFLRAPKVRVDTIWGRLVGTADSAVSTKRSDSARASRYADTLRGKILDSIKFYSEKVNRLYYGIAKGDTVYSKWDTSKTMKSDFIQADSAWFGTGTGRTLINPSGRIILTGTAEEWNDVSRISLSSIRTAGSGVPDWTLTKEGYALNLFKINDSLEGETELDHQFLEGDTIEFHLHWKTNSKDADTTFVKWGFHYIFCNKDDSSTYNGTLTKQDTIMNTVKSLTHRYTSLGSVVMANSKIGGYFNCIIKRTAASPATNPAGNPFCIAIGLHCKVNTMGSRTKTTK